MVLSQHQAQKDLPPEDIQSFCIGSWMTK